MAALDRSIYFPISRGRPVDVVNHLCGMALYEYLHEYYELACIFITSFGAFKSNNLLLSAACYRSVMKIHNLCQECEMTH